MELLPNAAFARWREYAAPADLANPLQWLLAACGVLVGAATHLVWDAFTHEGARGVRMIPALDDAVLAIRGHHLAGARLLQDASSLIGLAVVAAILAYGLRPASGVEAAAPRRLGAAERSLWAAAYVLMACVFSAALILTKYPTESAMAVPLSGAGIAILRGLAAALLLLSLALSLRLHGERAASKTHLV